jgi:hypothetical protein
MKRYFISICFAGLAISAALAQQKKTVPPPPKPADQEPSLAVTMKFIQSKMNDQGVVGYVFSQTNIPGVAFRTFYRFSDVTTDSSTCSLHKVETTNVRVEVTAGTTYSEGGKPVTGADLVRQLVETSTVSLKDVESIRVESQQDAVNRSFAQNGYPDISATIEPTIFQLTLVASKPVFLFHVSQTVGKQPPVTSDTPLAKEDSLHFRDEDTADRLAKALTHAIELCGGGNKDPF